VLFVPGDVAAVRPVTGSLGDFRWDLVWLALFSALGLVLVRTSRTIRLAAG